MKLKLLVGLAGIDYSLSPGDIHDFPAPEAKRLIAAGIAEAAPRTSPVAETALQATAGVETAAARVGRAVRSAVASARKAKK